MAFDISFFDQKIVNSRRANATLSPYSRESKKGVIVIGVELLNTIKANLKPDELYSRFSLFQPDRPPEYMGLELLKDYERPMRFDIFWSAEEDRT